MAKRKGGQRNVQIHTGRIHWFSVATEIHKLLKAQKLRMFEISFRKDFLLLHMEVSSIFSSIFAFNYWARNWGYQQNIAKGTHSSLDDHFLSVGQNSWVSLWLMKEWKGFLSHSFPATPTSFACCSLYTKLPCQACRRDFITVKVQCYSFSFSYAFLGTSGVSC